jgi:hypothetical protein
MRLLIRITMAASLIMADAAQAASLTEAQGERQAANERATSYEARAARLKNTLDRDEKTWKRLSASICTGCGSPPPPLEIDRAGPLSLPTHREADTRTPDTEKTASTSATQPASIKSAALQEHRKGRTRVVRSTRSSVRVTARVRRYARYAHLRMIRHQRHLALLQMRKQRQAHALLASRARHHAHHVKLAAWSLKSPFRPLFPAWVAMWTRLTAGFQRHLRQDQQARSWRRQ